MSTYRKAKQPEKKADNNNCSIFTVSELLEPRQPKLEYGNFTYNFCELPLYNQTTVSANIKNDALADQTSSFGGKELDKDNKTRLKKNNFDYNFVNVPPFPSKSVEKPFLAVNTNMEKAPIQLQREELYGIPTTPPSDPYFGTPLEISAKLATCIHDSFGIETNDLCLRESSEVSKMGALATAQGNVIRFAPDNYRPNTGVGLALLGHELSHVREQARSNVGVNVDKSSIYYDRESEAQSDSAGEAFASGTLRRASQVNINGLNAHDALIQCQQPPSLEQLQLNRTMQEERIRKCGVNEANLRGFALDTQTDGADAICKAFWLFPELRMNFFGTIEARDRAILEALTIFYSANPISQGKIVEELRVEKLREYNQNKSDYNKLPLRVKSKRPPPELSGAPTEEEIKEKAKKWATEYMKALEKSFDPEDNANQVVLGNYRSPKFEALRPEALLSHYFPSLKIYSDESLICTNEPLICTNELGLDSEVRRYFGIVLSMNNFAASRRSAEGIMARDVAVKESPIGSNVRFVIDHELGHAISELLDAENDPEIKGLYDEFMFIAKSIHLYEVCSVENERDNVEHGASSYAMRNIGEFIAECYGEALVSSAPRRFATAVYDRLIRLYMIKYSAEHTHVVKKGETLWSIVKEWYTTDDNILSDREIIELYEALRTYNSNVIGPNPHLILPGQPLIIPPISHLMPLITRQNDNNRSISVGPLR